MASASKLILSAVLLIAGSTASFSQATGRFTNLAQPELPGFAWSAQGFRAAESNGLLFKFEDPATAVKMTAATSRTAEWKVEGGRQTPTDLRVNLRSPGFDFKVRPGFRFTLDSLRPPLFTTSVGTYEGAPAPSTSWIMVSVRENVPPVLFAFRNGVSEMRVTGSSGQWQVRLSPAYEGWIRVLLPFGQRAPESAETLIERLGRQASAIKGLAPLTTQPYPRATNQRVFQGLGAMRLSWSFDRPGAVVPSAAILAGLTSGAQVTTPYRLVSDSFSEGPLALATGKEMSVLLPHGLLPLGRALTEGAWEEGVPKDEEQVIAAAPTSARVSMPEAVLSLYSTLSRGKALFGGSESYQPQKAEENRVFAEAAERQAWWINDGLLPDSSGLALASLLWKADPLTWNLSGSHELQAQVAKSALLAENSERRIEGLMLAYGLLARPSLVEAQKRLGFTASPASSPIPNDLLVMLGQAAPGKDWTRLLSAPFWIQQGPPAWLRKGDRTWVLLFMAPNSEPIEFIFRSRTPVQFEPATNLADFKSAQLADRQGVWRHRLTATPTARGLVEIRLKTPEAAFVVVPKTKAQSS